MNEIKSKWNQFRNVRWDRYFFGTKNPGKGVSRLLIAGAVLAFAIVMLVNGVAIAVNTWGAWCLIPAIGIPLVAWIRWAFFTPTEYSRLYD